MNYGPLIFLAAFFALSSSWFGLVLAPQLQVGRLQQTNTVASGASYPLARPGLAQQGRDVYRANGCASCHSQQVGQTATVFELTLNEAGTNHAAVVAALQKVKPGLTEAAAEQFLTSLPKPVLVGAAKERIDAAAKTLGAAGAKAQSDVVPVGPDIARGWGKRRTVAEDFLFDYPVMLGIQRIGPDLANVGVRQPDPNWHLRHLYAPRSEVKDSIMPPYRYLFLKRRIERVPGADALRLAGALAPEAGYEIVPTAEARALVAYLQSLRADAPLFATPMAVAAGTSAATATNTPAAPDQAATNAAPTTTNAPVK